MTELFLYKVMQQDPAKTSYTLRELSIMTNECYYKIEEILFKSKLFTVLPIDSKNGERLYSIKKVVK